MQEKTEYNYKILDRAFEESKDYNKNILAITIATKPCYSKLWSLMVEAEKQKCPFIILDTGQHYDSLLGHGIEEFNFKEHIAIDMNLKGGLAQKSAELFLKTEEIKNTLVKKYPGAKLIPYVNGDTMTAGIFPIALMFSTNYKAIQGEAGLRAMSPSFFKEKNISSLSPESFFQKQKSKDWILRRNEPFPEQYCTFISAATSEYHFAPIQLNKDHLVREGHDKENIFVVGNTIVDTLQQRTIQPEVSVFDDHPALEKDEWLRVDIHRRGNLTETRFKSIIGSVINLVEKGKNLSFIELTATKKALEFYKLRDKLLSLSKSHKNFLFTPLWREYAQVSEFVKSDHCWSILTDSGGMQEEMNEYGKPCMTTRFSTDRPETVQAGSNVLIPAITKEFISEKVSYLNKSDTLQKEMSRAPKLYGTDVGKKSIKIIKDLFRKDSSFHKWTHESLGFNFDDENIEYL